MVRFVLLCLSFWSCASMATQIDLNSCGKHGCNLVQSFTSYGDCYNGRAKIKQIYRERGESLFCHFKKGSIRKIWEEEESAKAVQKDDFESMGFKIIEGY